jgi:hypothetical protein
MRLPKWIRRSKVARALEKDMRPLHKWRVFVRVPKMQYAQCNNEWLPPNTEVDWSPPSSGPEFELRVPISATSSDVAQRVVERRFERRAVTVLAIRVERA